MKYFKDRSLTALIIKNSELLRGELARKINLPNAHLKPFKYELWVVIYLLYMKKNAVLL